MRKNKQYKTEWRRYQKDVENLFKSMAFETFEEKIVVGARARHKIDVWVIFKLLGIEHKWAIETKLWKQPVPKGEVLAFHKVVEDVGADKGILLSESGFQKGSKSAVKKTNILLSSMRDLKKMMDKFKIQVLKKIYTEIHIIKEELFDEKHKVKQQKERTKPGYFWCPRPSYFLTVGQLDILASKVFQAIKNKYPISIVYLAPMKPGGKEVKFIAHDYDGFVWFIKKALGKCKDEIEKIDFERMD